jgi:hypothetical protein
MDHQRAIERLIFEYAEMIDAGNFAGVGQQLANCVVASPADRVGVTGADNVVALFRQSTRLYPDTGTPKTKHVMTNIIVDVAADGRSAAARSQYTVMQGTDTLPLQPIVAGRYHDEFRRDGEAWSFARRNILVDFVGDVSQHLLVSAESIR